MRDKGLIRGELALVLALLLALTLPAGAGWTAEVSGVEFGHMFVLKLKGEIEPGDLEALTGQLKAHGQPPDALQIESPGGDPATAMAIGRFARESLLSVTAGRVCQGACLLTWLGGVGREVVGPIDAAGALTDSPELRAYLAEMEVPDAGIQILLAPRGEVLIPTRAIELFGRNSPGYTAWLAKQCDQLSEEKQRDWENIRALQAMEDSMSSMGMGGANAMYVMGPEVQAQAAAARELPPLYVEDLIATNAEITRCRRAAVSRAREDRWQPDANP